MLLLRAVAIARVTSYATNNIAKQAETAGKDGREVQVGSANEWAAMLPWIAFGTSPTYRIAPSRAILTFAAANLRRQPQAPELYRTPSGEQQQCISCTTLTRRATASTPSRCMLRKGITMAAEGCHCDCIVRENCRQTRLARVAGARLPPPCAACRRCGRAATLWLDS